ncbi:MAG TPA: B12-binding domain-containing radical SAM protein [Acidobacteriota bacterium]|nr:B12-binding domain-containing radical SAM protein [Acidobacteriota bacterium]
MTRTLLVYPKFPPSYWGYDFALDFVGKKSSMPPLGLLTVAGMLPPEYELRVADLNVRPLSPQDLMWADVIFTSTMLVQKDSLDEVIRMARQAGVPVVSGGPHPTTFHEEIEGADHFILGEVEDVLPRFLKDFQAGRARKIYRAEDKPDVRRTPLPRYDLIDLDDYGSMALQFSRGCPFDCEFCDITKLFGRVARTKDNRQILEEMDLLYDLGWRGPIFLVDDNFIGNKRRALQLLPEIEAWQRRHGYPFSFFTEASVNLARMDTLIDRMVNSGFDMVFLGIETPSPKALLKTKKNQNVDHRDPDFLAKAVSKLQGRGLEVTGGFILGLDGDREDSFDVQIDFIQRAGIPMAMVGLLTAVKGTDLYHRLQKEGRLLGESTGNNVSIALNFETELPRETLVEGYKRVLTTLYDSALRNYFERCLTMFDNLAPNKTAVRKVRLTEVRALLRSIRRQVFSRQGPAYLKFFVKVLRRHPRMFPEAGRLAIMGYHFQKVTSQQIAVHDFRRSIEKELALFRDRLQAFERTSTQNLSDLRRYLHELLRRISTQYDQIDEEFRENVADALEAFQDALRCHLSHLDLPAPDFPRPRS